MLLHAANIPASPSNLTPQRQHQLPSDSAPGSHSLLLTLHTTRDLATGPRAVLTDLHHSARDQASMQRERTGSIHQERIGQQDPAEELPSKGSSAEVSRPGLMADAHGMPHALATANCISIATEPRHDVDPAAAATGPESAQQASGVSPGVEGPLRLDTMSQTGGDMSSSPELKCPAPAAAQVTSHSNEATAKQEFASESTTGPGTQVTVTAQGKARAEDVLGHSTYAQTEPEASAVDVPQADTDQGSSPDYSTHQGPAAVAPGTITGTSEPEIITQAEAGRLADSAPSGQHPAVPMPAAAPTLAASGFSTGTGKAVHLSAAGKAQAAAMLAEDSTAPEQATSVHAATAAPTVAASGFSTGTGKAVHLSAAGKARAAAMLAEDSTTAKQTGATSTSSNTVAAALAPSGFSTGTGKIVHLSAAANARAATMFAEDSTTAKQTGAASTPSTTAAPTPTPTIAASGFTSGTGKAVHLSAAAQAQARSMFQDENTAPMHSAADQEGSGSTPAGAGRPGVKPSGVRPVLGTPRTGPTAAKPAMKRVKELSQSTGGKLFKKPRMSKIVSPFCAGGPTPNRVRLCCCQASTVWVLLLAVNDAHNLPFVHLSGWLSSISASWVAGKLSVC